MVNTVARKLFDCRVGVAMNPLATYDSMPPFHPSVRYPELPTQLVETLSVTNSVYTAVRVALANQGMDLQNQGSSMWNPFNEVMEPGSKVVIFPNGVMHKNFNRSGGLFSVITHGAVIRPVLDYVYRAIQGRGRIVIAHSPLNQCDFSQWMRLSGCEAIAQFYKEKLGFQVDIVDLRSEFIPWDDRRNVGVVSGRTKLAGDPRGYTEFDLGDLSAFAGTAGDLFANLYGADYDRATTIAAHSNGRHVYRVANTILEADCMVAMPKLKTHSKVGVTLNLKAMVGTQCYKNLIPHYRIGPPSRGGDQHPECSWPQRLLHELDNTAIDRWLASKTRTAEGRYRLWRSLQSVLQSVLNTCYRIKYPGYEGPISGGNWCGNDTAWRMTLDLTRIALYGQRGGVVDNRPQRMFVSVVDGIVGGEGDGPLSPKARQCGTIVCGWNPLAVDNVCARLMGFDPQRIPMLREACRCQWLVGESDQAEDPAVCSDDTGFVAVSTLVKGAAFGFCASRGWRGAMEAKAVDDACSI